MQVVLVFVCKAGPWLPGAAAGYQGDVNQCDTQEL